MFGDGFAEASHVKINLRRRAIFLENLDDYAPSTFFPFVEFRGRKGSTPTYAVLRRDRAESSLYNRENDATRGLDSDRVSDVERALRIKLV